MGVVKGFYLNWGTFWSYPCEANYITEENCDTWKAFSLNGFSNLQFVSYRSVQTNLISYYTTGSARQMGLTQYNNIKDSNTTPHKEQNNNKIGIYPQFNLKTDLHYRHSRG